MSPLVSSMPTETLFQSWKAYSKQAITSVSGGETKPQLGAARAKASTIQTHSLGSRPASAKMRRPN